MIKLKQVEHVKNEKNILSQVKFDTSVNEHISMTSWQKYLIKSEKNSSTVWKGGGGGIDLVETITMKSRFKIGL